MYAMLMMVAAVAVAVHTDPGTALGPLTSLGSYALGIGGVALTAGLKWLTQKGDDQIGRVDTAVTKAIKPVQPIVATALAFALPFLGHKLNLPVLNSLDPMTVVGAPIGVAVGISAREGLLQLGKVLGVTDLPPRTS